MTLEGPCVARDPNPESRNLNHETRILNPESRNPNPATRIPNPETQNLEPRGIPAWVPSVISASETSNAKRCTPNARGKITRHPRYMARNDTPDSGGEITAHPRCRWRIRRGTFRRRSTGRPPRRRAPPTSPSQPLNRSNPTCLRHDAGQSTVNSMAGCSDSEHHHTFDRLTRRSRRSTFGVPAFSSGKGRCEHDRELLYRQSHYTL